MLLMVPAMAWAQRTDKIKGEVREDSEHEHKHPLVGANVYWLGTTKGTATDESGGFKLERIDDQSKLVISYIGFVNDTIETKDKSYISVSLKESMTLEAVEIVGEKRSTEIDYLNSKKVEQISEKELLKAACCNLSESFETTPSVDVSFTDAVTGTRQVQMLGLAGPYTQITRENMPDIRGLSSVYGLTYTPGTWISGINLSKGTGSVVNGFESIAGQIDVNLRNPADMDKAYFNLYANEGGRVEANANLHTDIGKNVGTALLLHGKSNSVRHDRNEDGFMDHPLGKQFIALNRWELYSDKGLHMQVGGKYTLIDNLGGQMDYESSDKGSTNAWGMEQKVNRVEGWAKIGKVFQDQPWKSIGFQMSAAAHDQKSSFGLRNHDAKQNSLYGNLIYQTIIGNTNHGIKTGASIQYDDYEESLNENSYDRTEVVPGAFVEYSYNHDDKISVVGGLRADHHNHYGAFITPRLHTRYQLTENTVVRASAGRGLRTANILSDNNGLLASSRAIIIEGAGSDNPYGLDAEVAWNYGLNITQYFNIDYREGSMSLDFYRTDFQNQIVVDLDRNAQEAHFYNLKGESYSNSFQAQLDYELIKRLDMRIAYRWFDVWTTYSDEQLQKPLVSPHRAFVNLAYASRKHWSFDYTINWQGSKRLPDTSDNPAEYQLDKESPDFVLMNAQVSKSWKEGKFEVYVGVENLLDYRQDTPIVAADDPFGPYFDSSMVWGPIFGRNTYAGLRFKIF